MCPEDVLSTTGVKRTGFSVNRGKTKPRTSFLSEGRGRGGVILVNFEIFYHP